MKQILFYTVLLLASCSSLKDKDFIYNTGDSEIVVSKDTLLNTTQLEKEVSMLKYALRRAYSGYYFKNKKAVEYGIKKLSKINAPITVANFCKEVTSSFSKVRDRHLGFKIGWSRCPSSKRKGRVGKRLYKERKKTWTVDLIKKENKNILIITISRFPSSSSPKWDGFIDKVKKLLPKSEGVFLDMRGNGGGDDSMGYELAKALTGADTIPNGYGVQYKVSSDIGLLTRWNYFKRLDEVVKSDKEKKFFKEYVKNDKEKYWKVGRDISFPNAQKVKNTSHYSVLSKKPLYILQDNKCASSCESTIDFFEYIEPMKRVGENTAGFIHFGNLGFFILPHSRMRVEIASTYNSYKDNRFVEVSGIEPDIAVSSGKDAFEAAFSDFLKIGKKSP